MPLLWKVNAISGKVQASDEQGRIILSDNRIAAFATDTSTYVFETPGEGEVNIEVKLLFRRAFIKLMEQKGWDVPDIVMAWQTLLVRDHSLSVKTPQEVLE